MEVNEAAVELVVLSSSMGKEELVVLKVLTQLINSY
jgi:hypothetical protein